MTKLLSFYQSSFVIFLFVFSTSFSFLHSVLLFSPLHLLISLPIFSDFYFQFFSFSSNNLFQLYCYRKYSSSPAPPHTHTNFSLHFSFSFSSLSICFLSAIHRLLTASKYLSIILLCHEGDTNSGFVSFTASFSGHPCLVTELDLEN